jgi:Kef-type K+ transport system membrane component KefB/Trk K+ transport system NAD-binding subunit
VDIPAFTQVAIILLGAAALGAIGILLRQPLIVAFIAVGLLVGPAGVGVVTEHEEIELLASIGIAVLLFVVGLKLDVNMIRTIGPVAVVVGTGQIVLTAAGGFALAQALGLGLMTSGYVAMAFTFSSTIIIVKLLSDQGEIDALHGRVSVGVLIVQDIAVILLMIALTASGAGVGAESGLTGAALVAGVALKGVGLLAGVVAMTRYVLPWLTTQAARSGELLVLFAVAWAVTLAALGDWLGFSKEVGAFLAGVSLASTPYRDAIAGRLVTLRDFLLLFFFIDLGARLDLSLLGATIGPAVVFSGFVLLAKPLVVMAIMAVMGYRKRTSFLTGLTVGQISEFSLILTALGVSLGHVDAQAMGLVTFVGLITIGMSTYAIIYSSAIFERLAPALGVFERRHAVRESGEDAHAAAAPPDIILFGLGRYGGSIASHLLLRNRRVLGVDFDPQALARWREAGVPVVYGDAEDPELFDHLPLGGARWVVSTAPSIDVSRVLMRHLRQAGYEGRIAVACRAASEEDAARAEGATTILRPFSDAAEQAADILTSAMNHLDAVVRETPGVREVRVSPGSVFAGHTIGEAEFGAKFGVTVLAVSRSGKSFMNPGSEFQIFPGDRLILSGAEGALGRAIEHLLQLNASDMGQTSQDFAVVEIPIAQMSGWAGQRLADLNLRQTYGASAVSVKRPDGTVLSPTAQHQLSTDERLVVAGSRVGIARLRELARMGES